MWHLVKEQGSPTDTDILFQVAQGQEGPHPFLFSIFYGQECPTPSRLVSKFTFSLQGLVWCMEQLVPSGWVLIFPPIRRRSRSALHKYFWISGKAGFPRGQQGPVTQSPHPSYHTNTFKCEDGCTKEQQEGLPACHQGEVAGIWNLLKGSRRRTFVLPWRRRHPQTLPGGELVESWQKAGPYVSSTETRQLEIARDESAFLFLKEVLYFLLQ